VNPNGTKLYAYPFQTLRSPAMQSSIAEWASPNFHRAEYWPFLFLLMATAVALAWSPRRVRARDILLLLAGTLAALTSIRFIPFFVLVAVPVLSKAVSIEKKSPWEVQPASPRSRLPLPVVFNAAALLGMVVFTAWHISDVVHRQPEAEARVFPAAAASYLRAHPANPIFNHYDWGGYLIWKLYPETRVFIDGRADLYGDDLLRQFAGTYQLRSDWRRALTEWQIGTVLVPPDSALAQALRIDPAWTIGFEDARAVVFVRRASPSATPAPAI